MDLKPYRVKSGAVLAHHGGELNAGAKVDLPPHVANEIRHLVDPLNAAGEVEPWNAPDHAAVEAELASAKAHERISILEAAIAQKRGDLEKLESLHAIEVEASKAKAADKPKVMTQTKITGPNRGGAAMQD